MNIKQAKSIPINVLIEHLGGREATRTQKDVWYYSPFRPEEKTPSFKVIIQKNYWHDFATGQGGSILDLWLDYNGKDRKSSEGLKAALEALKPFSGSVDFENAKPRPANQISAKPTIQEDRFKLIKSPTKIWIDSLKLELERRGISPQISNRYLKQAYFEDTQTQKKFNGFAFANDKEGYEISVPNPNKETSFKTVIGSKAPTTIIGKLGVGYTYQANKTVFVFEGFWDYLSWLEMSNVAQFEERVYVLNSLSFSKEVATEIIERKEKVDTVLLFFDNDDAGMKATINLAELLEQEGLIIGSMNHKYEGFKDLNEFWQFEKAKKRMELSGSPQPQIKLEPVPEKPKSNSI